MVKRMKKWLDDDETEVNKVRRPMMRPHDLIALIIIECHGIPMNCVNFRKLITDRPMDAPTDAASYRDARMN